jgi:hypothetical protein
MALAKLGAKRINNFEDSTESSPQAVQCRLHFEQTRDALLRSNFWAFASGRAKLSQDTVDPDFEYDSQFILPNDYLAKKSVWSGDGPRRTNFSYAIEGDRILTNEGEINLRYVKKVTDPTKFDPLFIEVLVLKLALKMTSLAGANTKLSEILGIELRGIMRSVRTFSRQEAENIGRKDLHTWNDARLTNGGRIDSQLGS